MSEVALNPFKVQIGEVFLSNLEINFSGLLVMNHVITFKVTSEKPLARIALLRDQLLKPPMIFL